MQDNPTPAIVKESLTPDTPLLDAIRAEQTHQHAIRMALLDHPATQARIALAEGLASALEAEGFVTMQQQIFDVEDYHEHDVKIFLHVNIHKDHVIAGLQALMAVLAKRGGHLDGERDYSEAGSAISLRIHTDGVLRGWLADPQAAAA